MARLGNLSPLSFHPTLVHHCTRLSRPATPCGALPLVRLCIICGAVWHICSLPTLMALLGFPVPFLSFQRFVPLLLFFQASCLCLVEGAGFEPAMLRFLRRLLRGFNPFQWLIPVSRLSPRLPSTSQPSFPFSVPCGFATMVTIPHFYASAAPGTPLRPTSVVSSFSDNTTLSCASHRLPLSLSRTPSAASDHTYAATPL